MKMKYYIIDFVNELNNKFNSKIINKDRYNLRNNELLKDLIIHNIKDLELKEFISSEYGAVPQGRGRTQIISMPNVLPLDLINRLESSLNHEYDIWYYTRWGNK